MKQNDSLDNDRIDGEWGEIIFSDWWWKISYKRRRQHSNRQLQRRGFLNEDVFYESLDFFLFPPSIKTEENK